MQKNGRGSGMEFINPDGCSPDQLVRNRTPSLVYDQQQSLNPIAASLHGVPAECTWLLCKGKAWHEIKNLDENMGFETCATLESASVAGLVCPNGCRRSSHFRKSRVISCVSTSISTSEDPVSSKLVSVACICAMERLTDNQCFL